MKNTFSRIPTGLAQVGLLLALVFPAIFPLNAASAMSSRVNATDKPEPMETQWDAFFAREMDDFGVYGALMVAVQNGEVVFSKGYGYADASAQQPMDPERTIVRAGSIAKTLTATAVMQLAEQGRLDLDADVNDYLTGFKIPDTFDEPVTARHLINMTGGFDTRFIGIRASRAEEVLPLGEYLAERMPPRVLPPGRYRRYNDHELALAGYLVEVISGIPYERYVREHIFEPLEMDDSSVRLPEEHLGRAARGYAVGAGPAEPYPADYYYLHIAPGAGFNSTASDMAHYIQAHLQGGRYVRSDGASVRILQEATTREMHATAFTHHPKLWGQANSFDEQFYNGQRYLRKQGGAPGMKNNLVLLPEQGMGFYLFYNSDGTALSGRWEREVVKQVLAGASQSSVRLDTPSGQRVDPASYTGFYRQISDQTSETTIVQVQALIDPDLWAQVEALPDGRLRINGQTHAALEPTLFHNLGNGGYTAFELDKHGEAEFLFQARMPYEKVPWYETRPVQLGLLGFAVTVFLLASVVWVIARLRRKSAGMGLAGLVSGVFLLFLGGLVWLMLPVATGGDLWQFMLAPSPILRVMLALPLLGLFLAAGLLGKTLIETWKGKTAGRVLIYNGLVLAGVAALTTFLHVWNLLGWRF